MSDFSIPGITESQYNTDKIIAGLVKTKEIQLDRMQEDRNKFELQRDIWQSINILTNKLEDIARSLYNADSPFRQKFSSSSNESVLTVSNSRQAQNGEYTIRVIKIAEADSFRSNELPNDYQVSRGLYTFGVGENSKSFQFNGDTLKQFVTVANRHMRGLAQFNLIKSRGQEQVLIVQGRKSGSQNRLQFADLGKQFALDIGLILDTSFLKVNLLQESLISPFNELSNYSLAESKGEVSIGPGQELRISLPNSYLIRSGSVMRYEIHAPKDELPPISNTPSDNPEGSADSKSPAAAPSNNLAALPDDFEVQGRSRFSSQDSDEIPPPPSAELDNINIDSAGSDIAFIGIELGFAKESEVEQAAAPPSGATNRNAAQAAAKDAQQADASGSGADLLNPTANFYFVQQGYRIAAGPKEGEVQASTLPHEEILTMGSIHQLGSVNEVVIRNPNPDREIVLQNLRFENSEIQDDYLAAHPVRRAQDAKISYLGVETERSSNSVDDLLPGLTLNLKRAKPEEDIVIRTAPDYESISLKATEFVTSYNDLMTQLNVVSSSSDSVIREKTSFTEKQEEEARKVLGLLRGNSSVAVLKYRLTMSVSSAYPTVLGARVLSDVGMSTNLSGPLAGGGVDQSKLRGYLEFDTEIMRQALEENFQLVQDLFGRDNDGDFIVDSGSALEVQNISNSYTLPTGPIPYQVKSLDRSITDNDRRIDEYKDYLADYEAGLKKKYGRMEGALNQLQQQQQALQNFSDAMNK